MGSSIPENALARLLAARSEPRHPSFREHHEERTEVRVDDRCEQVFQDIMKSPAFVFGLDVLIAHRQEYLELVSVDERAASTQKQATDRSMIDVYGVINLESQYAFSRAQIADLPTVLASAKEQQQHWQQTLVQESLDPGVWREAFVRERIAANWIKFLENQINNPADV
jgi:hypothetical protein